MIAGCGFILIRFYLEIGSGSGFILRSDRDPVNLDPNPRRPTYENWTRLLEHIVTNKLVKLTGFKFITTHIHLILKVTVRRFYPVVATVVLMVTRIGLMGPLRLP